jgi:hypothetical protein
MSTALREAAQQILVAWDNDDSGTMDHPLSAAIEALRTALAQEEQEPAIYPDEAREMGLEEVALYTYPPCREWQRLTNEEMYGLYRRAGLEAYYPRDGVVQGDYDRRIDAYARAIEQALKEKNA